MGLTIFGCAVGCLPAEGGEETDVREVLTPTTGKLGSTKPKTPYHVGYYNNSLPCPKTISEYQCSPRICMYQRLPFNDITQYSLSRRSPYSTSYPSLS